MKSIFQPLLFTVFVMYAVAVHQTLTNSSVQQWGQDFLGTEFWVAFMRHFPNDYPNQTLTLYITNPASTTTNVAIESYGLTTSPAVDSRSVAPGQTVTATLSSELVIPNPGRNKRSVHLTSTPSSVQVEALMEYRTHETFTSGGFTVLPVTSLSNEYVTATHCETSVCVIVILAAENDVNVTAKLRVTPVTSDPTLSMAKYKGLDYFDDDHIQEMRLWRGDVMQIVCKYCDLTGTLVQATDKIAVFSGGDFTTVTGVNFKDLVVEQMTPAHAMGTHYVLGSSTSNSVLKVVTMDVNQTFNCDGGLLQATREREVFSFIRSMGELAQISSDSSFFVAHFNRGPSEMEYPEAVMVLPAPVDHWDVSYQFVVPAPLNFVSSPYESVLLFIVVEEGYEVDVFYSDTVTSYNSTNVTQGGYTMMTLNMSKGGPIRVQCRPQCCRPFSGYGVLNTLRASSSFVFRTSLSDVIQGAYNWTSPCSETTTTTTATTNSQTTTDEPTSSAATTTAATTTSRVATTTTQTGPTTFTKRIFHASSTVPGLFFTTDGVIAVNYSSLPLSGIKCRCLKNVNESATAWRNNATKQANEVIERDLTLNRKSLSSYKRRKMSTPDERVSSFAIGAVCGVVCITAVLGFLVGIDLSKFVPSVCDCKRRRERQKRSHFC